MQLRLVHTLSLTLLAFAGVAVLALGGLTAWHLRNGFGEYLASRDVLHFERFVGILESRLARDDGLSALRDGRLGLTSLLDELNPRPRPGERGSPSMPPPPPSGRSDGFPQRIQVVAPDDTVLLGEPGFAPPNAVPLVERPVRVNGEVVAVARMRPAPMVRTGAEARFLRDQYALIAAGGLGLIVLAVLTATWLARRWTRPLAAVQEATQRLAQGELTVRLPDGADLAGRSDEIGDVMRNVNRMAEGLQQLEGVRRRWLADISHELRTPLTVLRGDIEALQDGVRPLRPEAIAVLHEEVLRLNKLVDDLHLLAIADLQTLPCHLAADDALALVRRLHRRYEARACAAGLELRLEVPDELSALNELPVEWDAGRIEQLLDNLMENSLRYTDAPGQVRIRLACVDGGGRVVVAVDDSAPGVPAEQRAQLFEPLYRGDAARRSGMGGSGLGLAICQTIAKAHGGRLTASASALGGLCLTLDLPRSTSSATSSTGGAA